MDKARFRVLRRQNVCLIKSFKIVFGSFRIESVLVNKIKVSMIISWYLLVIERQPNGILHIINKCKTWALT